MRIRPLFLALAATISGIATAFVAPASLPVGAVLGIACALFIAGCALGRRGGALLLAPFFLVGLGRAIDALRPPPSDAFHLAGETGRFARLSGTVASAVEPGRRLGWRYIVRLDPVCGATGRVAVTQRGGEPPAYGDGVRVRGRLERPLPATNPGGFDYRASLARQGIHTTLLARTASDAVVVRRGGALTGLVSWLRTTVLRTTERYLAPADAALMNGLMLGMRSQLPADLDEAFARTGTVHILSTSGLHLAALAGALALLLRSAPRPVRCLVPLIVLWLFALCAGSGPAVIRSAIMASVVLVAPLVRREPEPLHALALAALGIVLIQPLALMDPGTQLSFATVALLLLWMPVLEAWGFPWEPGMPLRASAARWVLAALATGVVAHAASGPLVAFHRNRVSLIAPLANLLIAVLAEVLLLMGLLGVVVGGIPLVAPLVWAAVTPLLSLLRALTFAFAAFPFAEQSVASPPVPCLIAWYASLVGLVLWLRPRALRRTLFGPQNASL